MHIVDRYLMIDDHYRMIDDRYPMIVEHPEEVCVARHCLYQVGARNHPSAL